MSSPPLTDASYKPVSGLQAGNMYLVDYELLDGITPNSTDPCTLQYLAAPICLLYKNAQNKVLPIAIQVAPPPAGAAHDGRQRTHSPHALCSCSVFLSLDRLRVKTTRSSCQLMINMTGCWLRSGSAQPTSSTTRPSHTCSGRT